MIIELNELKLNFKEIYDISPLGAAQLTEWAARQNHQNVEVDSSASLDSMWESFQEAHQYDFDLMEESMANVVEEMNSFYGGE